MRILVTREMPPDVLDALDPEHEVTRRTEDRPMTLEEARAGAGRVRRDPADAWRRVRRRRLLVRGSDRLLANFGVGYNHIDVAAAKAAGMAVTNTPGAVTDATADIAMLLILMTCRRASEGERLVRAGEWTGWAPTQLLGLHLGGKTLGIVGMGRIGKAIARRATAFGMEIVFYNRSRVEDPGVAARQLELAEVLA